jgi:acyl-CoA thioesterase-1
MVNLRRWVGVLCLLGIASGVRAESSITVLFLGDSITAGLGIDEKDAFPNLIQARVDSLKWPVISVNDGLRGIDPVLTESNLLEMVARTRKTYPECDVVIAGMQIPTNLGQDYTEAFRSVFPSVADSTGSVLIPFLLEGVGGVAELNLPDGKHPTAEGHQIVADNVWDVLQPLLEERIRVSDRADGDP